MPARSVRAARTESWTCGGKPGGQGRPARRASASSGPTATRELVSSDATSRLFSALRSATNVIMRRPRQIVVLRFALIHKQAAVLLPQNRCKFIGAPQQVSVRVFARLCGAGVTKTPYARPTAQQRTFGL